MKKNIFKFAYIALALTSIIGVRHAHAIVDDAACGTAEGTCLTDCQSAGWPDGCGAGCQDDYFQCERPQQQEGGGSN